MNVKRVNLDNFSTYKRQTNQNLPFAGVRNLKVPSKEQCNELMVFYHHIYEYKKGLRSLILTTEKSSNRECIESRLQREKIPYIIHDVNEKTINVFFGNEDCIKVVSTFDKHLNKLSPEKDFMLGIMLGYDRILQCKRYMKRLGSGPNSK